MKEPTYVPYEGDFNKELFEEQVWDANLRWNVPPDAEVTGPFAKALRRLLHKFTAPVWKKQAKFNERVTASLNSLVTYVGDHDAEVQWQAAYLRQYIDENYKAEIEALRGEVEDLKRQLAEKES